MKGKEICFLAFLLITQQIETFQIKADNCNLVNLYFFN